MITTRFKDRMRPAAPCVATVGFFDGVHRGHRYLIEQVTETAHRAGMKSVVVTFDRHPREVLHSDYRPLMLTTLDEKLRLLGRTDADRCVVLPFSTALASLTAREFMSRVLLEGIGVRTLVTGYDNRFGHNRSEGFADYVRYGREMGIDVRRGLPFELGGVSVSSSVIRSFLLEGEVGMAARCLGYHYTLTGSVTDGKRVGRCIGFPTANLRPADGRQLIPSSGVYAVRVALPGRDGLLPAMTNIGCRPTFGGTEQTIETHIFDFDETIYGQPMSVSFVARLRKERKFRNTAELVAQLKRDAVTAKEELAAPSDSPEGGEKSQKAPSKREEQTSLHHH